MRSRIPALALASLSRFLYPKKPFERRDASPFIKMSDYSLLRLLSIIVMIFLQPLLILFYRLLAQETKLEMASQ